MRLHPRGYYYGNKAGAVTATVELAQGALSGETVISVPQTTVWNSISIDTYEGGRKHRDLSIDNMGLTGRYYYSSPDSMPAIVVVHWAARDQAWSLSSTTPDIAAALKKVDVVFMEPTIVLMPGSFAIGILCAPYAQPNGVFTVYPGMSGGGRPIVDLDCLPDIRALAGRFPDTSYNNSQMGADIFATTSSTNDAALERLVLDLPNFGLLAPHRLPDRWLDYTNIDVLVISRGELAWLRAQFPEKLSALRTWLRTGTTLCVYDAGQDFGHLGELESLMEADPLVAEPAGDRLRGWELPPGGRFRATIDALARAQQNWPNQVTTVTENAASPPQPSEPPFVSRSFGQGRIVALAAENPFPGTEQLWGWVFNSIPARNWLSHQRLGISQYEDNMHFWSFLVEGIGKAPVKSFLALITLFAIVIGPVNYYALHRRSRLYLLLLTVPLGASIISGGLFLFAMLGDGFGTRVRLRSYAELDQRTGTAVSWSRQTYYAGFASSRGLSYPKAAAVYPIEYRPTSSTGSEDTRRELIWGEDQQLASGYFYSRTMSQFLVVEPQSTEARVRVVESGDGPPKVVNELGAPIERLVLRDARGALFQVDRLENGESSPTEPADAQLVGAAWTNLFRSAQPGFPEGFDSKSLDDVSGLFTSRRFFSTGSLGPSRFETSVMEIGLATAVADDFKSLPRQSYVAILSRSPLVSLGVTRVRSISGFHVLVGRW